MSDGTAIEWSDATWNIITGCSVVSPGCTNCYAMKLAGTRLRNHPSRAGLTKETNAGPVWTGQVRLNEQWLDQPLRWKKPRKIFVCAHGDLFHENVPDEWIDKVFAVMALAPQHTFQVLTKRPERMKKWTEGTHGIPRNISVGNIALALDPTRTGKVGLAIGHDKDAWPLRNVWLGVSVERQKEADERIPLLLKTPAAIRFVSAEPLLAAIDFTRIKLIDKGGLGPDVTMNSLEGWYGGADEGKSRIAWVIVSGESGPGALRHHQAARLRRDPAGHHAERSRITDSPRWRNSAPATSDGGIFRETAVLSPGQTRATTHV